MSSRLYRLLPILLALLLLLTTVAPAAQAAESTNQIGTLVQGVHSSVVGILNTLKAGRETSRNRAAGTGFVYKEGVIITNAHVVADAAEVRILYADKSVEIVSPSEIFADKTSDIAVIKVKTKGLKPLPQANSDQVEVGQPVVAVGNPLGFRLGNSVSAGIISGTGRALGSGYPFLQTDAPINPGNSGGPLFNMAGEVIGINSSKMADIGVEGLGFAIPINTAKMLADRLLKDGKIERAALGLFFDEGWEAYFGLPNAEGVRIMNIIADGPAGLTALSAGDNLTKLDSTPIYTTDDIFAFLDTKRPGDSVKITVKRRGQELSVTVKLASAEALRAAAEEGQTLQETGILTNLTPSQIQDAAEYGRDLADGWERINPDYVAVSGRNYAILWTEYLYVARRLSSVYEFGFAPSVGFQQAVAAEINRKAEVQLELDGTEANFAQGATFTLTQGATTKTASLVAGPTYTTATDGSAHTASLAIRFSTDGLKPTQDLVLTVKLANGRTIPFTFTLKELR